MHGRDREGAEREYGAIFGIAGQFLATNFPVAEEAQNDDRNEAREDRQGQRGTEAAWTSVIVVLYPLCR